MEIGQKNCVSNRRVAQALNVPGTKNTEGAQFLARSAKGGYRNA